MECIQEEEEGLFSLEGTGQGGKISWQMGKGAGEGAQ